MPLVRRTASRLLRALPERHSDRIRRTVRGVQGRSPAAPPDKVTYVVSPHPDDETLRLAGYVAGLRERTERRLVLVAITDGGGSSRARRMGWSPSYEREFRRAEQAAAWSALTGGRGEIIRVGLSDGGVTAEDVRHALAALEDKYARFYVAAHEEDYHPDHRAVAAGVRLLDPAYMRFSLSPLMSGSGKTYRPTQSSVDAVSIADAAYQHFGHLSVATEFRALAKAGYRSRVTQFSGDTTVIQHPSARRKPEAQRARARRRSRPHATPVFVLGNQKSGSTAIAALLAQCIGEKYTGDVLHTNKLQLRDLLRDDPSVEALVTSQPTSFAGKVIKDNDFTFLYPSLARAFPEATFVFVVRDPRQNIRSVLNRVKLPGDLESLTAEQQEYLRHQLPGWHTILTGSSFGPSTDQYVDELANRWVRANEVYRSANEQMALVRYEDFDAAKRPVVEELAGRLGLSVVNDISEVQDRQYQPVGDRSISPAAFFGSENLERIERRCGPLMASFGYAPSHPS